MPGIWVVARRRVGDIVGIPDEERERVVLTGGAKVVREGEDGVSMVGVVSPSKSGSPTAEREGERGTDIDDGGVGKADRAS